MTSPDMDRLSAPGAPKVPFLPFPRVLRTYWIALLLLTGLAVCYQLFAWHHKPNFYPYDNPLFQEVSHYRDFTGFYTRFDWLHTKKFFTYPYTPYNPYFSYPAPVAVLYQFFYRSFPDSLRAFLAFSCLSYLGAIVLFGRALFRRGVPVLVTLGFCATVLLTSYPAALQLFVSNFEVAVWLILCLGIWAEVKDRPWLAAVCFGLAASMKLFPFVYFGLQLSRRQYRPILLGAVTFVLATLGSLAFVGPSIPFANRGIAAGLQWFREFYVLRFNREESSMDHTLYALCKVFLKHAGHIQVLPRIATPFLLAEATLGLVLYFAVIRRLPFINQLLVFAIVAVLLPPVSHDYTLLHLYAPWAMLTLWIVSTDHHRSRSRIPYITFLCFALLFTPENWMIVHGSRLAGQFKALCLCTLFGIALVFPFASSSLDELAPDSVTYKKAS